MFIFYTKSTLFYTVFVDFIELPSPLLVAFHKIVFSIVPNL